MIDSTGKFQEAQRRVRENDPPIEVNQRWVCYDDEETDQVFRCLKILAAHPDGGWIFQEEPAKLYRFGGNISVIPEFNLRYIFQLEEGSEAQIAERFLGATRSQ